MDVASERFEADGWCKLEPNLDHLLLNAEPLTADEVYDTHQSDCSAYNQSGHPRLTRCLHCVIYKLVLRKTVCGMR